MDIALLGSLTLILAAQDGCVCVRPLPYNRRRFTGNTVAETALLSSVMGRGYFDMADYDDVLAGVGSLGFGLQTPEDFG